MGFGCCLKRILAKTLLPLARQSVCLVLGLQGFFLGPNTLGTRMGPCVICKGSTPPVLGRKFVSMVASQPTAQGATLPGLPFLPDYMDSSTVGVCSMFWGASYTKLKPDCNPSRE